MNHPLPTPLPVSFAGRDEAQFLLLPDLHVPHSPDIRYPRMVVFWTSASESPSPRCRRTGDPILYDPGALSVASLVCAPRT
jgi:hypothetical protein